MVQQSNLRPWRFPPTVELMYGEWLRDDLERGVVPDPGPMPDLGPEVALARQGNVALSGPPPAELLDPVPAADLRHAVVAGVPSLLADLEGDTRNVLLTLARIWHTVATGAIGSKDDAAAWATERLPDDHRGVLNRARDMYLEGWDEEDWGDRAPAARALAERLVAEIRLVSPDEQVP